MEVLQKTLEHLYISMTALTLGILVAVPIGIFITRSKTLSKIIMSVASVLQTIPSFALLAFMIPFFGVGKKPAIIALFIYSLLPILRNTYLGMESVDKNIIDASKGMGMTKRQTLFLVKLPLAAQVIMAGIRLSAVYLLSWTTLASYIGAGGLGEFIFNGLENYKPIQIFQGTIPVTCMAILIDYLLGKLEEKLSAKKR